MSSPNPIIEALCRDADLDDESGIVSVYNAIKAQGIKDKLVYKRKVPLRNVGVHRFNRNRFMVSGQEAMRILGQVDAVGVSLDMIQDATAFEEPPTRINESAFIKKTMADPLLVNCEPAQVEISSVA